jgi:hypothetical protein
VLASRLRDLNIKIEDIRREQQYQREREADFRDLSETTNSRAVFYSIAQIAVLLSTCAWQLRHLRVSIMAIFYLVSNVNGKLSSDSSRIGRCASLQLHTIYMFQVHYTVTFCGNCVYFSSPSILMITFFLKLPNANLRKISLIALEACTWLASSLTVTISCFGSLN